MITQVGVRLHPAAECLSEDCGWEHGSSSQTRQLAKAHVRATGHEVIVVVEDRTIYRRSD